MPDISVLPAPRADANLEREFVQLAEQRVVDPARRAGLEVPMLGATVLPQRQTICRTDQGAWLLVDHTDDPTASHYRGKIPIPAAEIAVLRRLHDAGVHVDTVWLAHELPATYRAGDAIPRLVPVPRELREKDERLTARLTTATELFLKAAALTLTAAVAAPLGVIGVAAAATPGLDPVILGGVTHPTLPLVQWCLLAQWEWE